MTPTFQGEVQLAGWSETHSGGCKVAIIAGASPQAIALGITANAMLQAAAPSLDGRGGGNDDVAQGGGTNADGIPAAFAAVDDLIRQRTGQ